MHIRKPSGGDLCTPKQCGETCALGNAFTYSNYFDSIGCFLSTIASPVQIKHNSYESRY